MTPSAKARSGSKRRSSWELAGDWYRFARLTELLRIDWRDTLMAGGLGDGDWSDILDRELPTVDPVAY